MRRYRVAIVPAAAAAVRDLHPDIKRSIRNALEELARDPRAGVELRGELAGLSRYRVRRYRIVYEIGPGRVVHVLAIGHRKTIYEDLADRRRDARPSKQRKPKPR